MDNVASTLVPIIGVIVTLVALISFFVKWLIGQATQASKDSRKREAACLERVATLEGRVQRLEDDYKAERGAKHEAMSDRAAYLGTLKVVRQLFEALDNDAFCVALPKLLAAIPDREGNQL
jgi:hypothetical protein